MAEPRPQASAGILRRPIGMKTATYFEQPSPQLTTLYQADGKTPYPYWNILLRPAGSINASAKDMALETMHSRYGGSVCLHGAVDAQKLLVSGSPAAVKAEVGKIAQLWGRGGGIIVGPSHEATPDTPIENIRAMKLLECS